MKQAPSLHSKGLQGHASWVVVSEPGAGSTSPRPALLPPHTACPAMPLKCDWGHTCRHPARTIDHLPPRPLCSAPSISLQHLPLSSMRPKRPGGWRQVLCRCRKGPDPRMAVGSWHDTRLMTWPSLSTHVHPPHPDGPRAGCTCPMLFTLHAMLHAIIRACRGPAPQWTQVRVPYHT